MVLSTSKMKFSTLLLLCSTMNSLAAPVPSAPYGPEWQSYYRVDNVPGVTFNLPGNYAGSLSVNRTDHPESSIFFWGFEANAGSLAASKGERSEEPWAIWLNGGPGRSSLNGLFNENGPVHIGPNMTLQANPYAWSQLADYIWVDQPVGVGFSHAEADGYAAGQVGASEDFVNFLTNLVTVFPSLATRPFYLTGESYAGRYIPYIGKKLFSMKNPPVKLVKMAIGAPALGSSDEFKVMPVLQTLKTHPTLIGYDLDAYNYFEEQTRLCGLDVNLSYPQQTPLPSMKITNLGDPNRKSSALTTEGSEKNEHGKRSILAAVKTGAAHGRAYSPASGQMSVSRRSSVLRPTGVIDTWYGCDLFDEVVDYALNYTWPWSESHEFDAFDVPDAVNPDSPTSPESILNNEAMRAAIHAPNKTWHLSMDYPWGSDEHKGDPSPDVMTFLDDLVKDAEDRDVKFVFYVGNDDGLSPHLGTQASIQNTTFGGIRGFTEQPSTPWYDDSGDFAGIVHTERSWTFAIVYNAGHQVAVQRPGAAYVLARDYIFSDAEDTVLSKKDKNKSPSMTQDVLPANGGVAYGRWSTAGMSTAPVARVSAFYSALGIEQLSGTENIGSRTSTPARHTASATNVSSKNEAASRNPNILPRVLLYFLVVLTLIILY